MQWPSSIPSGLSKVYLRPAIVSDFDTEDQGAYRQTSDGKREIAVNPALKDGPARDLVLAHEVIHSWLDSCGLANLLSTEQEEAACDAIAPYVVQFGAAMQREVRDG